MAIIDTQIISYYYKKTEPIPSTQITISSITAAEFLLIQSRKPHKANYYPVISSYLGHHSASLYSKERAALGKHRTDQILLNFGGVTPSLIEFGSVAISQIINGSNHSLFVSSISHLNKALQKKLRNRFDFLIQQDVQCIPFTPEIGTVGINLLAQFLDKYNAKQNIRNTINDILILSTAVKHSTSLLTEDNLLRRFAADFLGAICQEQPPIGLLIDFSTPEVTDRRKPLESKGYINKGWQILERQGR